MADKVLALLVSFLLGAGSVALLFSKMMGFGIRYSPQLRSYLRRELDRLDGALSPPQHFYEISQTEIAEADEQIVDLNERCEWISDLNGPYDPPNIKQCSHQATKQISGPTRLRFCEEHYKEHYKKYYRIP